MHTSAFNGQDALKFLHNAESLLLGCLSLYHFAVYFFHRSENDRARELVVVFSVDTLLANPVGNVKLQILKLVSTLHVSHLLLAFVENLDNDLVA